MKFIKNALISLLLLSVPGTYIWHRGGNSDFDEVQHAEQQIGIKLESKIIPINELKLHVVFAGPENGEPVVLLHGFPQFWYMWRHHIAALAAAGYRVAAPDMRGYNRSDKPFGRAAYSYPNYAKDIIGLLDSQGWNTANLVSHDIGGAVAWELIFSHANRFSNAIVFSTGHPLAYAEVETDSQISLYRNFFRVPLLPELFTRAGGMVLVENSLRDTGRTGLFSEPEMTVFRAAWDRDHARFVRVWRQRSICADRNCASQQEILRCQ